MNVLKNSKNKKVAVMGLGVSGISALRLLKKLEADVIAINTGVVSTWAKSPGVLDFISLDQCFAENDPRLKSVLSQVEIVILSPGIPRDHDLLHAIHKRDVPVWGEIELAYRLLEDLNELKPIIGITGTNGKTTTTTFLGEMIEADNKKVFVGGNIGIPFCDYAFDVLETRKSVDFILLELSSFQLESIDHFHVNIAIFLNLFQNHGERYSSIEDYGRSKFNITNRFTNDDVLIYPNNFSYVSDWAEGELGNKKSVNTEAPSSLFDLTHFKLPGIHNKVNLNFILLAAESLGLSSSAVQKTIDTFVGVHHRIEFIDDLLELPNFVAYNDAKSTNWDATITAVRAMEDILGDLYLIVGGKKRGHGDSLLPFIEFLKARVHTFYLIGEMSDEMEAEIKGLVNYKKTGTLELTIADLREQKLERGGILLFSPGFPSFDQFKNYAHRGEHFKYLLQHLN